MKVELRTRKIKGGNYALYLDITHEGRRTTKSLNLYLVPEYNKLTKQQNENTLKRAQAIRAEYILHQGEISFRPKREQKGDCSFPSIRTLGEWLDQYEILKYQEGASASIMTTIANSNKKIRLYLDNIHRPRFLLKKIDKNFVKGYLAWLGNEYVDGRNKKKICRLSPGTLKLQQTRLNSVLNRAVREGLIDRNPFHSLAKSERYKAPQTKRDFLTKDELMRFLAVKTDGKATQQAFGFASFTGLRISDILALTWGNIRLIGSNKFVYTTTQKTDDPVMVPLCNMALRYLPEKTRHAKPGDKVFHLPTPTAVKTSVKWIAAKAGITKNVSFHTSRHTFATLVLEACKDIKTVSRLLGHKSVKTTQIYAEVPMETKMEAISHLDEVFGDEETK